MDAKAGSLRLRHQCFQCGRGCGKGQRPSFFTSRRIPVGKNRGLRSAGNPRANSLSIAAS